MGASDLAVPPVSPVRTAGVPLRSIPQIVPYDPDQDPLRDLSPALAERRRRLTEAALKAAERSASAARASAEHERKAAKFRASWARAVAGRRIALLGADARAALMARGVFLIRPQMIVVHPGGFFSWCRTVERAVLHEAAAPEKSDRSRASAARAGALAPKAAAAAKTQQRVAVISRSAGESAARIALTGAVEAFRELKREPEARRVARRIDRINDRLTRAEQGSSPLDARTLTPVIVQRSKGQVARTRIMRTASKFKGGRRAVAAMLADLDQRRAVEQTLIFGQVLVAPERVASIRAQVEMERNRRIVPRVWTEVDVDVWLTGAYETLLRIPMNVRPREYGNAMPKPTNHAGVEWGDELARLTLDDEEAVPTFGRARLRALGMPDKIDVDRMNVALHWTSEHLAGRPALVPRCVGFGALWKALEFPREIVEDNVDLVLSVRYQEFDDLRGEGLRAIAGGLNGEHQGGPAR